MRGQYVRSAIRAEVRRAMRDGRSVNRQYLHDETGLSWNRLEVMITEAAANLASAPPVASGGGQGPERQGGRRCPTSVPSRRRSGSC